MDLHTSSELAAPQKLPIEALSKEELLIKYKGLLGIAKKAKQAKDEFAEENRQLKEALSRSDTQKDADKKALVTMKEMIEEFTENKLSMATQLSELHQKSKKDDEIISQLRIENESMQRQIDRLNEDNESLLNDIDRMESRMNQVNLLGKDQKKSLDLLELEVNKLKEAEKQNAALQSELANTVEENKLLKEQQNATTVSLTELTEKYQGLKSINSEQRKKFNSLKDRFMEVLRKLKNLKECKRILLETQYEYSEAVSKWQNEIIRASHQLCAQMSALKADNEELQQKLKAISTVSECEPPALVNIDHVIIKLTELQALSERANEEQRERNVQHNVNEEENKLLKEQLNRISQMTERTVKPSDVIDTPVENNNLEMKCLLQELEDLKVKLQNKEELIRTLELSNDEMKAHQAKLQEQEQTTQDSVAKIVQLEAVIEAQKSELSDLRAEVLNLDAERNSLAKRLSDVDKITTDKEMLRNQLTELTAKIQQNAFEYDEKTNALTWQIESLEMEKTKLKEQIKDSESKENEKSRTEIERLHQQIHDDKQAYEELLVRYEQKEREHTDLLDEMRELNEALKARGDVISRQQEKQQELVAELKKTNAKLNQIDEKLNEKEQVIKEKEEEVRQVTKEVDETRNKVSKLETVCAENKEHVRNLTDEIQNLRSSLESSVQDMPQSDALSTSTISRADELSRLAELDENYEEKYHKLRGLALKLKKKLQDQTQHMVELEKQRPDAVALHTELENCKKTISDWQHEREQNRKLIETLKTENNKLKSSRKQSSVLNLEIEAAEKSLKDATSKLTEKSNQLEEQKELMKAKENIIVQLRKEITILESAKEAECNHSRELKEQIDHLNNQLKDVVHSKQTALVANKELEQTQESLKLELEELRLQLADITSRHEKVLNAIKAEKEALQEQLLETKCSLDSANSTLKLTERSLEDLRVEYVEYKLKAQAVLKKNQNTNTSKERELEEEVVTLHAAEKQLQAKLQTNLRRIEELEQRVQTLQMDNDALQKRNKELLLVLDEVRQQNENLSQDNHIEMQKHQESLKNQREQIENLDKCYKTQLQELEGNYQKLKDEYAKVIRIPPTVGAAKTVVTPSTGNHQQQPNHHVLSTDQSKIDYLLMEREDAEGSEEAEALATIAANRKISNASRRRSQQHHDFLPLDELLNVPMNTFSDTVTTLSTTGFQDSYYGNDDESNNNFKNAQLELQTTKESLHIQEARVRHLTALLAENEQDLAKLTQMNDMLKEELRRQERAVEREKHMAENSEYLKNVIIKFVTLSNSDERTRLVPVLNTILRLSRAETEVLNCVARGQKVPTDSNNRGWSDFLPKWGANNN